jgi:hypothetical protein
MPPAGFEPVISADERQQTHALDGAATGVGLVFVFKQNEMFSIQILNPKHPYLVLSMYVIILVRYRRESYCSVTPLVECN